MDGVAWAALFTSLGAIAVAGIGWYAQRRAGLPSELGQKIRDELEATIASRDRKITRLEGELTEERTQREADGAACGRKIEALTDALLERDLVIAALHRRLGMVPPHMVDPRA